MLSPALGAMMTSMPGSTSLRLIATRQQRHSVARLWQLYRHDLSEFRGYIRTAKGFTNPGGSQPSSKIPTGAAT